MEDFVDATIKAIVLADSLAVQLGTPPSARTASGCIELDGTTNVAHPNCLVRCAHTMFNDNGEIVHTASSHKPS